MWTADNGALVRHAVEAIWNRGEVDLADQLIAADYINHGGLIPDLVRGPEAVKVAAALVRAAFPDLRVTVEDLVVQGEMVTVRWRGRRQPDSTMVAASGPGTRRGLTGRTTCKVAGRQIVESWTDWDAAGELRRAGLFRPAPSDAGPGRR